MKKIYLYPDRPETSEDLKFAHRVIGDWFERLLVDIAPPFRIAITGALGSGKSTIVQRALHRLEQQPDRYATAYVDVWKLDENSARRSAILQLAKQFNVDMTKYRKLKKSIYGQTTDHLNVKRDDSEENPTPFYEDKHFWFVATIGSALGLCVALGLHYFDTKENGATWLKLLAGVAVATYSILFNYLSRMILQVKTTVARSPFVGPEEFEEAMVEVLNDPEVTGKRVIIVFDNIDRAPRRRTEEILTGISAFFDNSSHDSLRNLVILVPFSNEDSDGFTEKLIQKFFDAVIPLPKLVPDDLVEFSKLKLDDIGWQSEAEDIAQLIDQSNLVTPRQILHFLNEMIAKAEIGNTLESNKHSNEEGELESYLPEGAITKNRIALAKVELCRRLWPAFLDYVVAHYIDPRDAFSSKSFNENIDSQKINLTDHEFQQAKRVVMFLKSTENLPKNLPESFEPFLYFKASDAEASIQGGVTLRNALIRRRSNEVAEYLASDVENKLDNITQIFRQTAKRNKDNFQRLRNATASILEAFSGPIDHSGLRLAINTFLESQPRLCEELPISLIKLATRYKSKDVENTNVWKHLDNLYQTKAREDPKDRNDDEFEAWKRDYLLEVIQQPGGLERAQIESSTIPSDLMITTRFFNNLGDKYPGNLETFDHAIEAINLAIKFDFSESEKFNVEACKKLIEKGLAHGSKSAAQSIKICLEKIGLFINEKFNGEDVDVTIFKNLTMIVSALPISQKEQISVDDWKAFQANLNSNYGSIQKILKKGGIVEVLVFLINLHQKSDLSGHQNLINIFPKIVKKMDSKMLLDSTNQIVDGKCLPAIVKFGDQEFKSKLKEPAFLGPVLKELSGEDAEYMLQQWEMFCSSDNLDEIINDLPDDSDSNITKSDLFEIIKSKPEKFGAIVRLLTIKELPEDTLKIETPIVQRQFAESGSIQLSQEFVSLLRKRKPELLAKLAEDSLKTLEKSDVKPWTMEEIRQLVFALSDPQGKPSDYYGTVSDRTINRAIILSEDANVVNEACELIIDLCRTGVNPRDFIESFEDAAKKSKHAEDRNHYSDEIAAIRKKYHLKKKGVVLKTF